MIGEVIRCENEGCEVDFAKRTHNQRYHDSECTRLATNKKIMVTYYDNQARLHGRTRYCATCQTTQLSRYNPETVCNSCSQKAEIERNESARNMLAAVLG